MFYAQQIYYTLYVLHVSSIYLRSTEIILYLLLQFFIIHKIDIHKKIKNNQKGMWDTFFERKAKGYL